jgi:hypothetical protein
MDQQNQQLTLFDLTQDIDSKAFMYQDQENKAVSDPQ